jgi:hypothetical protein
MMAARASSLGGLHRRVRARGLVSLRPRLRIPAAPAGPTTSAITIADDERGLFLPMLRR